MLRKCCEQRGGEQLPVPSEQGSSGTGHLASSLYFKTIKSLCDLSGIAARLRI